MYTYIEPKTEARRAAALSEKEEQEDDGGGLYMYCV